MLGLARIPFLHSSLNGAVFWICEKTNVDNTPVSWQMLSSACTALVSLSPVLPSESRLKVVKKLDGNTARISE